MINYLESQIDGLIQRLIDNDLGFGWKNHPLRNHQGIYLVGEPFDYILMTPKYKWCFDCKMVDNDKWYPKNKDLKQSINLKKVADTGIDSFFLFLWNKKQVKKLEINNFLSIITDRKFIKISDCELFDYKVLFPTK